MSNKVTPATLSAQKEIISSLNSQSILLQLSYAKNQSISKIKQDLMQQLFYVSQETSLKAKLDFQTNSGNTLLADGSWNPTKPQSQGGDDDADSFEDEGDEAPEDEDHIIEEEYTTEDQQGQEDEGEEQEQISESSP